MLYLKRRLGESVCIGNDITVTITRTGSQVGLKICAPTHIPVHREELYQQIGPTLIHPPFAKVDPSATQGEKRSQSLTSQAD